MIKDANDILLYPIGFDISRLYNSLLFGVISSDEYKKRGLIFIKSSFDSDNITIYSYDDYINGLLSNKISNYINNSINLVLDSSYNIIYIAIPSDYGDLGLKEINYLSFNNLSYEEVKDNCDMFLSFLGQFGYVKDDDKYDSSYNVLKYSYLLNDDFNDDIEEARNYLNEDIGYDVRDTFRKILNKSNITLLDLISYFNDKTLNIDIIPFEDIDLVKRKIKYDR